MPTTYEKIATTTLGSASATITFSSIPSTYTDIRLVLIGTNTTNAYGPIIRFNNITTSTYSSTAMYGDGSSATSIAQANLTYIDWGSGMTVNSTKTVHFADIFSYAGSTNKTVLLSDAADKNGSGSVSATVGLWRNTAAISTITVAPYGDQFAIGTTATIYGIKAA